MHIDDTLEKLKTRLVARGFTQTFKIDFEDIFALIVKFDTLRVFLVIVMLKNLECYQINVNNVFTKFFLKKKIYMALSLEVDVSFDQCLRILRNLYELKQVVCDQHERYVKEFIVFDFKQCDVNSCLLVHFERQIMLLLYVNDIDIAIKLFVNVD